MSERSRFIEDHEDGGREQVFTHQVRAGKRTYFFDVKVTRRDDHFVTITESKKRFNRDGRLFYEKHTIFLYKEDFKNFLEGLGVSIDYVDSLETKDQSEPMPVDMVEEEQSNQYTDVDFDDLEVGVTTTEEKSNE